MVFTLPYLTNILAEIKEELKALGTHVPDEYDRCHGVGHKYKVHLPDNEYDRCHGVGHKYKVHVPDNEYDRCHGVGHKYKVHVPDNEYDRYHGVGHKYKVQVNGKKYQDVLLKLCFWRTRDLIYQNMKKFSPYLTLNFIYSDKL